MGTYGTYAAGSMSEFFYFLRKFAVVMFAMNRFPNDYLPPEGNDWRNLFVQHLKNNSRAVIDFELAFIAYPRIHEKDFGHEPRHHPGGDNIHLLLLSKFWRDFFAELVIEHGYKEISKRFQKDFLRIDNPSLEGSWSEGFDLHFIDPEVVEPTVEFWKQFVSAESVGSIEKLRESDFTLMSCINISNSDTPGEIGIGFMVTTPEALCDRESQCDRVQLLN